jgi:hypothetical protein
MHMHGVSHGILQVFILIFYENVFQNPELFPTQGSLSPEQSTLAPARLRGHRKTYLTILESADHALFKMVCPSATSKAGVRCKRESDSRVWLL